MASTRRMVLLGGLGATGALVVGYALWPSHRLDRADALAAKPNERFIANWIKIAADDTVTVVIPHCDMGTGIYTALSQMAAEELDADWSKVRIEAAPPDPLFANGALAEGFILEGQGLTPDSVPAFLRGVVDNAFRTAAAYVNVQTTGGSSAVRFTGVYGMRVAGAAAREMLVKAAAARWNVDPLSCATKANRVFHAASGRSLGYGSLVADAATYTPSSHPSLKPKSRYTLVGRNIARIDIPRKVDGTTTYGLDVVQPGMLYAAIKISPVFGGTLKSVDSATAEAARGVGKVVRLDDAVVVVADRFWRARDAVAALDPVWDTAGSGVVTSAGIAKRHAAALAGNDLKKDITKGNGAGGLLGSRVVEATYTVPYLAHAPMEPMNATALWKDGALEVWSGTQDGLGARAFCARTAGVSLDKVTYHLMPMGGGFGRRLPGFFNFLEHAVKTAVAMPGTPVKLIYTRDQDMQHDYYRPNVTSRFKGALDGKGNVVAWLNDYTTDEGANTEAHIVYGVPDQAIRTVKVATHVPVGPWRSVEASWHGFFIESFADELAHAAGKDPLEFRHALLANAPRHLKVLDTVAEKAGWGTPMAPGRARGIAIFECFQTIVAHVVEITVGPGGALKVDRIVSAVDAGMAVNPDGLTAQIEGGIVFGLTAALNGEITIDQGAVVQANFPDYEMVRLADCPKIEVHLIESDAPLGGGGEPGVPPVAPALANAIFAATGIRIRDLPVRNHNLALAAR
ncbi:MAG: molybdopterin cofactor-binding domain-containing protein [Rhizomicrobium sp.]